MVVEDDGEVAALGLCPIERGIGVSEEVDWIFVPLRVAIPIEVVMTALCSPM